MKTIHYSTKAKKDLKKLFRKSISRMNLQEIIKAAWNVMSEMIFF